MHDCEILLTKIVSVAKTLYISFVCSEDSNDIVQLQLKHL